MRIVVVVPFLDEERFLPRFLASMAAQTRRPDRLVLVDDGSTDRSAELAAAFAARHDFAVLLRRPPKPPRKDRLAEADELKAFLWAVEQLDQPWDVVAKMDGDLELNPRTIEELARRLADDPRLGLVGSFLTEDDGKGGQARLRIRAEHVHGATKFYRRTCFEDIAPLAPIIGWDTMDEVKARMRGWRTQSFAMPGGDPLHLRRRASADGLARGYRRMGGGAYALGDHPLHVLLYGLRQMRGGWGVRGGAHYLAGWCVAALQRRPRADHEVRRHIRRDELRRMRRRALRLGRPAAEQPAST